ATTVNGMKLATFNVNGINGRLAMLLRWLAEAQPDIACLQELKAPDEKFPEAALREAGYRAVWHGQKSCLRGVRRCRFRRRAARRGCHGTPSSSIGRGWLFKQGRS